VAKPTALPPKPSVLDKLLAPVGGARSPYDFPVPRLERFGERELRDCIQRDLAWLLNDVHLEAAMPLDEVPEVRSAVINQGVPEITGLSLDNKALEQRNGEVLAVIRAFEQRLLPDTLRVQFDTSLVESHNKLHFTIQGEIRNAVEEAWVEFSTTVDLADGHVEVAA
jgi:type VI secretion system protein ImpF